MQLSYPTSTSQVPSKWPVPFATATITALSEESYRDALIRIEISLGCKALNETSRFVFTDEGVLALRTDIELYKVW